MTTFVNYVRKAVLLVILTSLFFTPNTSKLYAADREDMIKHPEKYIKILDYGFYVAARVGIIHHVRIQNTADISYRNIKVKLYFYSTGIKPGQLLTSTGGVLPVLVPPNSTDIYLKGGTTLGAGSNAYDARDIQVLGAVPVTD